MREINLNRQKLGLEDLLFGVGIVTQIRAGQNVEVTKINAGNLPFDETRTLFEWAQSINLDALGSMTTELQAIYDNLTTIGIVEANLTVINNLGTNIVALNSLYTNISKLQNIDTNISKLQNIDTNISKLQNIDTNMTKLQAIYTDLTKLENIYDNLTMLLAIYNNLTVLNNINSQVIPNLTELLLVNDNAAQVAADKLTVATDKVIVSSYKDDVSAMKVAVESIYDTFDDRFLGVKTNDPTLDNDGNALTDGAMYFNTSSNALKVYSLYNTTWYTIPQIYLSGLLDVMLTSITTGDILTWNGTKWVNTTIDSKLDLHGRTAKTTPVDADEFMIADSATTWGLKKITWANIKTALVSVFIPKITTPTTKAVPRIKADGTLENSAITIDDNGNIGSGIQSFNGFGGSGFKNYIINGNFDVWQYGVSGISTGSIVGPDMWRVWANVANTNWSQAISTDFGTYGSNIRFGLKWYGDPASNQDPIEHRIESKNAINLSNKYVTISFVAKSSVAQTVSIELVKPNAEDNYTTTTAISSSSIPVTTTATKFSVTLLVNDVKNGLSCIVRPSVKNQFMYIAQAQLEEGSIATPFENRPYGLELSLCQRYYEKVDSVRCNTPVYGTGTGFIGSVKYKVPKRTVPTISLGTPSHWRTLVIYHGAAISTLNAQDVTDYGFDVSGTSSGGNITAGYAGKIQVNDGYTDNGTDGIFVSAEL